MRLKEARTERAHHEEIMLGEFGASVSKMHFRSAEVFWQRCSQMSIVEETQVLDLCRIGSADLTRLDAQVRLAKSTPFDEDLQRRSVVRCQKWVWPRGQLPLGHVAIDRWAICLRRFSATSYERWSTWLRELYGKWIVWKERWSAKCCAPRGSIEEKLRKGASTKHTERS